jgi:hypothetical protein
MQHQVKGRAEILAKFNAKRKASRKPGFDGPAILLGSKGGLTRKKIKQTVERLKLKRELKLGEAIPVLESSHNIMQFNGLKVTSTDLATRLSLKYLMRPLKQMGLEKEQLKAFEALILKREQMIKGTNIQLRPPLEFLILNLANSFGENGLLKAGEVSRKITQRGETLRKLAQKSKNDSDAFYNVLPRVATTQQLLTQLPPETLIKMFPPAIRERELELERLKKMNITDKETFVKLLEGQIKQARREYILFRQNNQIL